jgi:Mg-chelatase subunit ChlI
MYLNCESLRREVLELENEMKVLRNSVLYDFYKRFGMTNALMLLDTIKQIVAKDYNWDANLLSRDLKDVRQWREMRKQEQERQHMTTTTASPQPAPQPSSPSTPQSQEEAVQSSPSQSDAKPSAADAEPTTHENEEHEEESQEGGGQTDAEGNKERR